MVKKETNAVSQTYKNFESGWAENIKLSTEKKKTYNDSSRWKGADIVRSYVNPL